MRVEQSFSVAREPAIVFDYMSDPELLAEWQKSKVSIEQITPGPVGEGTRFRETTKGPGGREFDQTTEFTEFDRPRKLHVSVVEGPVPVDGTWTLKPAGMGTDVHFLAEGELTGPSRLFQPLIKRMVARQFAGFHENLRHNVEALPGG